MERDKTFEILQEEAEYRKSDSFNADIEYFNEIVKGKNWSTIPKPDNITNENKEALYYEKFQFLRDDVERLSVKYGLGKNGFYVAATAIALSFYNKSDDIIFIWTWNGRSDNKKLNAVGLFIKYLPIALHLNDGVTLSMLFDNISTQIKGGISHTKSSYGVEDLDFCVEDSYEEDMFVCLLYQSDIYEYIGDESVIKSIEIISVKNAASNNALDIQILDAKKEYGILLDYNEKQYYSESMKKFSGIFCRACELMLKMDGTETISHVKNLLK